MNTNQKVERFSLNLRSSNSDQIFIKNKSSFKQNSRLRQRASTQDSIEKLENDRRKNKTGKLTEKRFDKIKIKIFLAWPFFLLDESEPHAQLMPTKASTKTIQYCG